MSRFWIFRLKTSKNFARHVLKWEFLVIFKHCIGLSNQSNFKLDLAIRSIGFSFPYKTQKAYQTLKTVASFSSNCCGSFIILKNSQQVDFQHSWTKRLNHIFCAVHKARKIFNRTFISWSTNNYQPTQRGFPNFKKSRNVVGYHTLWGVHLDFPKILVTHVAQCDNLTTFVSYVFYQSKGLNFGISKATKGGGLDLETKIQDKIHEIHEQCESRARYLNGIFEGPVFDS